MSILTPAELAALRKFDSPTIANALERFNIRPRNEGFMGPEIKRILGDGPIVGYAYTAKIAANDPPTEAQKALRRQYWEGIVKTPKPVISVLQDVDPKPVGSFWGEVNASIHTALGCIGTITNGGVRDLDEVEDIGFTYFASCVLVSHAYIHIVEVGQPVEVGGITISPGDLIHADKHGVITIPHEVAKDLAAACEAVTEAERPVIEYCRARFESKDVDLDILQSLMDEMGRKR
ncbi:MAG: RraA family protein [Limnochordia bacterium]